MLWKLLNKQSFWGGGHSRSALPPARPHPAWRQRGDLQTVGMIDTTGQTIAVESASSDGTVTTMSPENLPSLPLPQLPRYAELVYLEEFKKGHFKENC